MFSALSKLADKSFVVGYFLPALLCTVCLLITAPPDSFISSTSKDVFSAKKFTDLTLLVLGIWSFAVLLVALNYWIYRCLEGYRGPLSASFLRAQEVRKFHADSARVRELSEALEDARCSVRSKANNSDEMDTASAAEDAFLNALCSFRQRFPHKEEHILPTRLGNVIRAFEGYPGIAYNVESISVWPRLQSVIPSEFLSTLTDAKAQVDLFVNIIVLATGLSVWYAYNFVLPLIDGNAYPAPLVEFLATVVVARISYGLAVSSAMQWGEVVKAAFDTYLSDLAHRLGYALPLDTAVRRDFWEAVANQFQYHEVMVVEQFPFPSSSPVELRSAGDKEVADSKNANDDDPVKDEEDDEK